MDVVLFLTCRGDGVLPAPLTRLAPRLVDIPGLIEALLHVPAEASDPYLGAQAGPSLVAELRFGALTALEDATSAGGVLARWLDPALEPWFGQLEVTQQAMACRRYVGASQERGAGATRCTYLVAYTGRPADYGVWLRHYLDHHVPLMRRLPALRELEVYTRLDWLSELPLPREDAVQRNKVVFDDAASLTAALHSPSRREMRQDSDTSPPFEGGNVHYPMTTYRVA